MITPDLRAAENAVDRLEAGKLRAGDLDIIVASWRQMRETNLALEAEIHRLTK